MADHPDAREPVLLGSAATAWPEPGCRCRTCRGSWLPGGGPAVAPAGLQVGPVRVGGVGAGPVAVWFGDGPPQPVRAGDAVDRSGMRMIGLPAGDEGVALVLGVPGGPAHTVLWCAGAGHLPEQTVDALAGAELEVAVLAVGPAEGPLSLGHALARLRAVDALAPGCDVVAIGFDHVLEPTRLAPTLAEWGVRIARDGSRLGPAHSVPPPPLLARSLVLGPASSGKSVAAETLLASEPTVDYVATGPPPSADDPDWTARVMAHRQRRPSWWRTIEGTDVIDVLGTPGAPVLLDSLGTWVALALDRCGAWNEAPGWRGRFDAEADALVDAWRNTPRQVVAVGEETGWGVVPDSASGRRFREALGSLTQRLAAESERVLLVVAGRLVPLEQEVPGV
ncbi:MAG TPA: bifunctional adenosylcobinamide kinase/adenosylcobinamide-phosphate guanylyltransferase [Kineosporiaceae bacterium]